MKFLNLILCFLSLSLSSHTLASIRMATYNIRNFDYDVRSNTPTNKAHLVKTLTEMGPDLLAVQEIHNTNEFKSMIKNHFSEKYDAILSKCGGAHEQHLGFVYNTEKLKLLSFTEDMSTVSPGQQQQQDQFCYTGSRPLAIAQFKRISNNEVYVGIAVHLKSGGQDQSINKRFKQLESIAKIVDNYRNQGLKNIIIMGDFNSTEYILKNKNYKRFVQTIEKMELKDTTKDLACSAYWWGGTNDYTQYPSTLDHIIVSEEISKSITMKPQAYGHCKMLKCQSTLEGDMGISFDEVSDHCPILTEIK